MTIMADSHKATSKLGRVLVDAGSPPKKQIVLVDERTFAVKGLDPRLAWRGTVPRQLRSRLGLVWCRPPLYKVGISLHS